MTEITGENTTTPASSSILLDLKTAGKMAKERRPLNCWLFLTLDCPTSSDVYRKRSVQGELKFISRIIVVLAILLVITTLVTSLSLNGVASPRSVIYDKQFVNALRTVSSFVPANSVVVTSTNAPFVVFFSRRTARVPFGVSSEESLLRYMLSRSYTYLLVFEGSSQIPELSRLFSSSGLVDLRDNFDELVCIQTDFSKIHLYTLSSMTIKSPTPSSWSTYTISDIDDVGTPLLSDIKTVQIRVTDNGRGPLSIWLGRLSLVDIETKNEMIIDTFANGHSYSKQSISGKQEDDMSYSVEGLQSLKLTTDGDGRSVFTRKKESKVIDFTGKTLKLWTKISDSSRLRELRITVTNDEFENYRNFWISR